MKRNPLKQRPPFVLGNQVVSPGSRQSVELPVALLFTHTPLTLSLHVIHGRQDGPRLFVSAAIHGDELNGVEVIRRLLWNPLLTRLRGTLILAPVVNVLGFLNTSRYFPDRRDLNRAFPGSPRGSLAAQLAELFMREVVARCSHGIDLHTGANHRFNLPQVRGRQNDAQVWEMGRVFGAPIFINASLPDGSLRKAAAEKGVPVLLYEAGEALRFDEIAIRAGEKGVLNVMRHLGMLGPQRSREEPRPLVASSSTWVRAPEGGVFRQMAAPGQHVGEGELLAVISDPIGQRETPVRAPKPGLVIGHSRMPVIHRGDGLFHLAHMDDSPEKAQAMVEGFHDRLEEDGDEMAP